MKIHDFLSPQELKRLLSALMAVVGLIAIMGFFGFIVVPGLRFQAHTASDAPVLAVQGETGWLDPTEYPATARRSIPPVNPDEVMTPNPELTAHGQTLFAQNCVVCHGADGKGDGPGAIALNPKPRNFADPKGWTVGSRLEDIYKTLDEGVKNTGMASFNYLSMRDRMALAHVVQSFNAMGPTKSDPKDLAELAKLFGAAGEEIPNRIPVSQAVDILCREYQETHGKSPGSSTP